MRLWVRVRLETLIKNGHSAGASAGTKMMGVCEHYEGYAKVVISIYNALEYHKLCTKLWHCKIEKNEFEL